MVFFKRTHFHWFGFLQGERGTKGERGEQGYPGLPGEKGERGSQGPPVSLFLFIYLSV